ncbi:acetamidase/formamidase family protein [candidate division KSB1 bacterium]
MARSGIEKKAADKSGLIESFPLRGRLSRRSFLGRGAAGIAALSSGMALNSNILASVKGGESMGKHHSLSRELTHNRWNRDIPPILRVNSGDTVRIETKDADDGHFTPESTAKDVDTRDRGKVHPLTGPIYIEEAEPGDVLQVDIIKFELADWGWTLIGRDVGFLPEEFPDDFIKIWRYDADKKYAWFREDIRVELAPFCGVMGTAWDEPGEFRTFPPRKNGGNMDVKHLIAGTILYLPVSVPGALFSTGDGHAAQGDGEVCVSAIETELAVTVRLTVRKDYSIEEPEYESDDYYATTGVGTTIIEAAQKATRFMINRLANDHGMSREEAYVLCSNVMDLKICEVVDLPNYLVSGHVSKSIFI